MPGTDTSQKTITFPNPMIGAIDGDAGKEHRTFSNMVVVLLAEALAHRAEKKKNAA